MKYLDYIKQYWYYLFIAAAISKIFYTQDLTTFLIPLAAVLGILSMEKIKWNIIDYVIVAAIIYGVISFIFSDYPSKLYFMGIKKQLLIMFFYFIARATKIKDNSFFDNFKWPMLFVIVCAIPLYFFPPGWYNEFRYAEIDAVEGSRSYFELTRMSSFFPHPYFLGYGSCFFIIFIIKKIVIDNEANYMNYVYILLALFTLFFAQMRIAIAYALLFITLTSLYSIFVSKRKIGFFKLIIIAVPLVLTLFYFTYINLNKDFLDYVNAKSIENNNNIIDHRFTQFSYFYKYISLFGNGLGRFGHSAIGLGLPSCADNDYIRTLSELGYIGLSLLLIPIIYALFEGFKNLKNLFLETFILLFFLFAMLGATPFESSSQHSFLIWYCTGRIITLAGSRKKISKISLKSYRNSIKLYKNDRNRHTQL